MDALVLSGGGSKGSYQIGVLQYCCEHDIYPEGFGLISGTSVGAINALALGMYPPDYFPQAVDYAEKMWRSLRGNKDIWKNRFPPYLAGLWKPSLRKTDPLRRFLDNAVDQDRIRNSEVKLRLPAVDLLTGHLVEFDETCPDLVAAAMASGSFPVFFPPVEIDGGFYTDGGVRDIAPLGSVIDHGADRILVVLTGNPHEMPSKTKLDLRSSYDVLGRVISTMTEEIVLNDVRQCRKVNKALKAGRSAGMTGKKIVEIDIVFPTANLSSSLEFSPKELSDQISLGYEDAKAYFQKEK